jgi:acetyltransferase-like isoleucine patch superfamily enzyme
MAPEATQDRGVSWPAFGPVRGWLRFRAAVSPRADVAFGPWLSIGRQSKISSFVKIRSGGGAVSIGRNTDIGVSSFIGGGRKGVKIGDDCLISPHSWIAGADHGDPPGLTGRRACSEQGPIEIGNNVWIGAGAAILGEVAIGQGAIISPNSVVTTDIPANAIAQGNPAKVIFIRR